MIYNNKTLQIVSSAEDDLAQCYKHIDEISFFNQQKVLNAFQKNRIAMRHFSCTSGYGYDDVGRDTLCKMYADVFNCEAALVSPNIASGTHALTIALFGLLRPNDFFVSVSGTYDTLNDVINGDNIGSLKDFNIKHLDIPIKDDQIDIAKLIDVLSTSNVKMVFIQRSRGYSWRNALSIDEIKDAINNIKKISPSTIVVVDNCYGEFVEQFEPTDVGADLVVGSLIKNIGGGLATSGGYIAGKKNLVELCANRFTAPSVGMEIGSYNNSYQYLYQGLFIAPHVVAQALKCAMLFGCAMSKLGYQTLPTIQQLPHDIICSIKFPSREQLISFCQDIQSVSPVDSYVTPLPWDMPGYNDQVIMAAGCFVQGASIELSCDSPIVEPYIAYLQGALTYEHAKIAVLTCVETLLK